MVHRIDGDLKKGDKSCELPLLSRGKQPGGEEVCVTLNPKLADFGLPNSNPFEEGAVAYMCPGEEGGPPVPEDPHLSYQIPDSIFAGKFDEIIWSPSETR